MVEHESGVTAIGYALIAALIAVAAIGSFILIGTDLSTTFSTVAAKFETAALDNTLSFYCWLKISWQPAQDSFCRAKENRLPRLLTNLVKDESGVTAIEYALIAALIAVAAIAAFTLVGTNLSTTFSTIAAKL